MAKTRVNISIEDGYLDRMDEVVRRLQKAGLASSKQMKDIGVVTGSVDQDHLDRIRRVAGVAHVEQSRQVSIPEPSKDVQ
jgi:hypothetical protein